jgi:hypothetical protein
MVVMPSSSRRFQAARGRWRPLMAPSQHSWEWLGICVKLSVAEAKPVLHVYRSSVGPELHSHMSTQGPPRTIKTITARTVRATASSEAIPLHWLIPATRNHRLSAMMQGALPLRYGSEELPLTNLDNCTQSRRHGYRPAPAPWCRSGPSCAPGARSRSDPAQS